MQDRLLPQAFYTSDRWMFYYLYFVTCVVVVSDTVVGGVVIVVQLITLLYCVILTLCSTLSVFIRGHFNCIIFKALVYNNYSVMYSLNLNVCLVFIWLSLMLTETKEFPHSNELNVHLTLPPMCNIY